MNNVITGSVQESFASFRDTIFQLNETDKKCTELDLHLKDTDTDSDQYVHGDAFTKRNTIPFPESLANIVHHPQAVPYKCGFLPSVNELWLSSKKSLYIWNFTAGNNIFKYECHEDIENVEVCIKESDLYVCTKNDISVHSFEKDSTGKLNILSNTKLRTNGVVMSNIYNTDTKRTFMQGNDGHLYEMDICRNNKGITTSIKNFTCLTEQSYMRYFSYFIQSVPEVPIKMISVDNNKKLIYILLKDSTIQTVDIQGGDFNYEHTFKAENIEYIQIIPSSQSKVVDLVAVNDKGDRYYLSNKASGLGLVQKRLAPPVYGSPLFHEFTDKYLHQCFSSTNTFGSICKSHENYLLLTCPNLMETTRTQFAFREDFYVEKVDDVYTIMGSDLLEFTRSIEDVLEPSGKPSPQIFTLNRNGITCYVRKRLIDRFTAMLAAENKHNIIEFSDNYGTSETIALCLLKGGQSDETATFLKDHPSINDGLLLYVSRLCKEIWTTNILKEVISLDIFEFVESHLEKLYLFLEQANIIDINSDMAVFIKRCKEGAGFTRFLHKIYLQDKSTTRASVTSHSSLSFEKLVSTEEGAFVAKDLVVACIEVSSVLNTTSNRSKITDFLSENCSSLLGENNIVFYRGLECHEVARNEVDKQPHLDQSLEHFKQIINLVSVEQLKELCSKYCAMRDYIGSVKLVLAKYHIIDSDQEARIQDIIFETKQMVLNEYKDYFLPFVQESLNLLDQENYHYRIYKWLIDNKQTEILTSLSTVHIVRFFTTLPENEGCDYLFQYYIHQKNYNDAVVTLKKLATKVENIALEKRIEYLDIACKLVTKLDNVSEETTCELKNLQKEAAIQSKLRDTLSKDNIEKPEALIESLSGFLKPAKELFDSFAYPNKLYEEALYLMDLMELYDWKYSKLAWTNIIERHKHRNELQKKLVEIGKQIYPSFVAYPTYILVHILDDHCAQYPEEFEEQFVMSTFTEVGIPQNVITELAT